MAGGRGHRTWSLSSQVVMGVLAAPLSQPQKHCSCCSGCPGSPPSGLMHHTGITAHFMELDRSNPRLQSQGLALVRGLVEKVEQVCDNFNIKHKLDYIISDNASNMKKAFMVCFLSATSSEDDDLENGDLWEDANEDNQNDVESIHSSCWQKRLQCFAHSLQLVVRDGLKDIQVLNSAMAKVTIFDSTLRLVGTVTDLDLQSLNTLLDTQGYKDMHLSAREWGQLKELVEMLAPFLQAMDFTQGKKVVTLRAALTCILSLNCHLIRMLILNDAAVDLPFGDIVYMMSTLLNPSFCLFWLEQDVQVPDEVKSRR
ncbi:uncharacterized protein lrrc38b isoform X2 [Perca flavescens]|uniref:uncharacterized protein lrrc38b isoform X2 n=1 Tax=Perca flavescens TaxID=8167 RepID=UPI00106F0654|nr:uncharacterized protein LOC114553660 isoform X2 [Perca flavescens]XP_028430786.1 uncharacterized protein LOC114553660 isoform X2 [Perca flavescens]XP_028430787.1 uncharacterized protein LOC114553660 isoform X2 [Perca flavescens]